MGLQYELILLTLKSGHKRRRACYLIRSAADERYSADVTLMRSRPTSRLKFFNSSVRVIVVPLLKDQ